MLEEFIGGSHAICKLRKSLPTFSNDVTPLVIIGEAGVGKHLFASHIHAYSPRSNLEQISLNFSLLSDRDQRIALFGCGPPELSSTRKSVLEHPTTVILKHIDKANHFIQNQLATSMAANLVTRPGLNESFRITARLIFTFQKPIPILLKKNQISLQLAEIIQPFKSISIPPLQERQEDIILLAKYYHLKYRYQYPRSTIRCLTSDNKIDPDLLHLITTHRWKENVRDLTAYLRSIIVFPYDEELNHPEKLEVMKMLTMIDAGNEFSLPEFLSKIERGFVERAINKYQGKMTKVAQKLGLTEGAIRKKHKPNRSI
ncbi:MAG: sigma 54-interacting transcriptional regulator [Ignavibacteriales bacterium]|nr:sigma 54-interacting transcriptional regulator [Ignavibacteriales bacterium]